jgi:cysteine desulfurase
MIYLDHNATTPLRDDVLAAMLPYLRGGANASSAHGAGRAARAALEAARRTIAAAVGAEPRHVVFTSGGTESNNLAILGAVPEPAGAHLVVSPIEHASVLEPVRELERRGAAVTWLPVDAVGRIAPSDLRAALRAETALVAVGWANNEIGTVQPIGELAAICAAARVPLHVDAAQALGKLAVRLDAIPLCAISAHKLGGPVGIGALIVRDGVPLAPLLRGGPQERGRRAGTESVAAAVGFAAAVAHRDMAEDAAVPLREHLWEGLAAIAGMRRYSPAAGCLPNTLNVGCEGVRGDVLVAALDLEGVAVSVGSACAAGAGEPSHVLRALGYGDAEARAAVRFSIGRDTTGADIATAIGAVRRVIARIRGLRGDRAVA